ncbi:hypothetical protein AB0N07_46935 [Streptomyces sp. NPDC051172]|uniref:hypothetical protein n=1 Tax=Streptomyces sp. NPDC051172 TaxID=3155796 RepID=UPI0034479E58
MALVAARVLNNNGDPDLHPEAVVAVCSDVPVHEWVTLNMGTLSHPDRQKANGELRATGHDGDPLHYNSASSCIPLNSAFSSRVVFRAPAVNDGQPFSVTAPADRKHVLVVRFTKNADGRVTGTQEQVDAPG